MMTHTPAAEALTGLILETFRLNGVLLAAGDRLTQPTGQTSARWQVLGAGDSPMTVAAIARAMGLARQSVQRTADLLEAEGLIEYGDNPAHRRSKLVRLTPRGRRVLDDITRRQIEWTNALGERMGLDEREIGRVLAVVRRFREELELVERQATAVRTKHAARGAPRRGAGQKGGVKR